MGSEINELISLLRTVDSEAIGDIINLEGMRDKVLSMKRNQILEQHQYQIFQSETDKRWRTYIMVDGKRKMIAKSTREAIEDEILKHHDQPQKPSLNSLYPEWHRYKSAKVTTTTMCNIDSYWVRFYEGTPIIRVPLDKLDYITLDKWAHDMVNQHQLTAKQYGNMSLIMRQVLDYSVDKDLIAKSPFYRVRVESRRFEHTKKKDAIKEVFLIDEQPIINEEALKDSELTGTSLPLAIPLAFQTGLRIGEILGLKSSDVEDDYLHIQRMEVENRVQVDGKWKCNGYKIVEHTKTKAGNRKVILTTEAKELIERAKALNEANGFYDDDFIFVNEKGRVHFKAIDSRVKKYCRKAGITEKSIHKIRKTYISTLIDANLNIDQIRRLVGHENEQTTYQSYCFNRLNESQTIDLVRKALSS